MGYRGAQGMEMGIDVPSLRGGLWVLSCGLGGLVRGMGGLGGSVAKRPGWTQGTTVVGKEMALGQAWLAGDGISIPTSPLHPQHPHPRTHCTPYTHLAPLKLEQPPALSPPQHPPSALGTPVHPPACSPPSLGAMCVPLWAGSPPNPPSVTLMSPWCPQGQVGWRKAVVVTCGRVTPIRGITGRAPLSPQVRSRDGDGDMERRLSPWLLGWGPGCASLRLGRGCQGDKGGLWDARSTWEWHRGWWRDTGDMGHRGAGLG